LVVVSLFFGGVPNFLMYATGIIPLSLVGICHLVALIKAIKIRRALSL
jgi:hypothetical protein